MTNGRVVIPVSPVDSRVDDPNFLLCVALTYLGLPPGLWRVVVNGLLEAASEEYRHRYGQQRGSKEFEQWRGMFRSWSAFNIFKVVIVFLAESKIGVMPISNAASRAIRGRVLAQLARVGVRMSAITGASQIIRKVTIYLEIAWITGCAGYCGGMAYANTVIEFSRTALEAVATFMQVVQVVGQAVKVVITEIVARPVLIARAMLDPSNWDTSPMPSAALVVRLLGNSLWSQLQPDNADTFLAKLSRPISEFSVPRSVVDEIAIAMTNTVNARGGVQKAVTFTSQLILGLTPLAFVQLLKDWRLLRFQRDPAQIADKAFGY